MKQQFGLLLLLFLGRLTFVCGDTIHLKSLGDSASFIDDVSYSYIFPGEIQIANSKNNAYISVFELGLTHKFNDKFALQGSGGFAKDNLLRLAYGGLFGNVGLGLSYQLKSLSFSKTETSSDKGVISVTEENQNFDSYINTGFSYLISEGAKLDVSEEFFIGSLKKSNQSTESSQVIATKSFYSKTLVQYNQKIGETLLLSLRGAYTFQKNAIESQQASLSSSQYPRSHTFLFDPSLQIEIENLTIYTDLYNQFQWSVEGQSTDISISKINEKIGTILSPHLALEYQLQKGFALRGFMHLNFLKSSSEAALAMGTQKSESFTIETLAGLGLGWSPPSSPLELNLLVVPPTADSLQFNLFDTSQFEFGINYYY